MTSTPDRWSSWKRCSFRFLLLYFVLFATPGFLQATGIVAWMGGMVRPDHDFQSTVSTGSGDGIASYVRVLAALSLSVVLSLLWCALDRRRPNDRALSRWLAWGVRYYLAVMMLVYGFSKVLPVQFGTLGLSRLVQPYGDSSPMGLLWTFMAYSREYTFCAGLAEVLAGLMLLFLRTTTLGALLAMAVMSQVFLLNLCYDVPVKLFSLHLLLMGIGLAAGDLRRLADFFLRGRTTCAADRAPLFSSPRANRVFVALKAVAIVIGLAGATWFGVQLDNIERPHLYGIHDVETFEWNGEPRPPLLTDPIRWRSLVVDRLGCRVGRMDGSLERCTFEANADTGAVAFALPEKSARTAWTARRLSPLRVELAGALGDDTVRMILKERDLDEFLLVSRGFHWISPRPFNR